MFTSLDAVLCTLLFIIPGFIIESMLCRLSSENQLTPSENILKHISFSAISAAASWIFISKLLTDVTYIAAPKRFLFYSLMSIFIIPLILGLLLSYAKKFNLPLKIFRALGFNPKTQGDTGWDDFAHSYFYPGLYAKFIMKSGKKYYVQFGIHDFISSSDVKNADIYASNIFSFDESKEDPAAKWEPVNGVSGVIIPKAEIEAVLLFGDSKETIRKRSK